MKTLVTGGAGFIGSNLVEQLLNKGFEVVVYDDFSTGTMDNLPNNDTLQIIKADIRDLERIKAASKGVDVVFHLAAQVGNVLSLENPEANLEINAKGTLNAIAACVENKIPNFIYSSSCANFGETHYTPIDEKHPLNPVSPYGATKLAGEQLAVTLGNYHNIKTCCLRYFNVYGKNQRFNPYGNVLPIFAERLSKNQSLIVYGDGNQTRDFIDVRDVVDANILAFEKNATGIFNIGTGTASTVNQLVEHIKAAVNKPITVTNQSPRIGEVKDSVADITKAREQLKFVPKISLQQGVKDYFEWFTS